MDSIIDALIFELYFLNHMKERNIDILQFVEKDMKEVIQDQEFKILSDAKKEIIINELHTRGNNSNSEIVRRMNSFADKSPEILKLILES